MMLLKDLDVSGKRVFLRADLDVEETLNGKGLTTNARLLNLEPTVKYLLEHEVERILIAGHIGRPQGPDANLSTKHLLEPLKNILGQEIFFQSNFEQKNGGKIVLFENLRFWPGEEANDFRFAKELAALAGIYVNDAFAVCHRKHASVVALAGLLPHAVGLHLEEEVNQLTKLTNNPERPMVVVVGGAKLETKIPVIDNLSKVADWVLVGGAVALQILNSPLRQDFGGRAKFEIRNENPKVIIATMTEDTKDIDKESIEKFRAIISGAKTVVWNGPVGLFEEGFSAGTKAVAQAIIDSGAYSVVGGGETTEFLASANLLGGFSFVSAGGGAMLEFLAGKELPGIEALE